MRKRWHLSRVSIALLALLIVLGAAYYQFVRRPQRACFPWADQDLPGMVTGRAYLFVAMGHCNSVLALDTSSRTVAAHVSIPGRFPHGLYHDRDHQRLYVANERSDDLVVITLPAFRYHTTIPVGAFPPDVTAAGANILTADFKGNSVTVIDHRAQRVVTEIPVGKRPMTPIATPDRLYVANIKSGSITVIGRKQHNVVHDVDVGGSAQHMALAGHFLYVTNPPLKNVQVIDMRTNTLVAAIFTGPSPQQIAPRYVP